MNPELSKASNSQVRWFIPELANRDYGQFGDAYNDDHYWKLTEKWNIE